MPFKQGLSVVEQVKQILLKEDWKREAEALVGSGDSASADDDSATYEDISGRIISECTSVGARALQSTHSLIIFFLLIH
jgi:hypothetical protein